MKIKSKVLPARNSLKDGFSDHLFPVAPLDLSAINSIDELVTQMSHTAFAGRALGEAADVLYKMVRDKDCFIVLTLSGAMTVAKMGLVACDMIERGMAHALVSTGAIMAHGFVESVGMRHFKHNPSMNDNRLYQAGYNRIYDTIELEKNLDDVELIIQKVLRAIPEGTILSSRLINEKLGQYLSRNTRGRGILKSAYLKKVPVYVPAFTDSELGLDVAIHNRRLKGEGKKPFTYDPFLDLEHFAQFLQGKKRLGIFTVGGGVPRNWAQQIGPYLEILHKRIRSGRGLKRYHYGVRICPEPAHWGGLSGCTYQEGVSWGKFTPLQEGGRWAEVLVDATVAWPLIVKAVMERLEHPNPSLRGAPKGRRSNLKK